MATKKKAPSNQKNRTTTTKLKGTTKVKARKIKGLGGFTGAGSKTAVGGRGKNKGGAVEYTRTSIKVKPKKTVEKGTAKTRKGTTKYKTKTKHGIDFKKVKK
jgi:hypothetical protein